MPDAATEAAAEALLRTGSLPLDDGERAFAAEVAVAAARPIIEAEVRERIAAEIEAQEHESYCWTAPGPDCICHVAEYALLVRGGPRDL